MPLGKIQSYLMQNDILNESVLKIVITEGSIRCGRQKPFGIAVQGETAFHREDWCSVTD